MKSFNLFFLSVFFFFLAANVIAQENFTVNSVRVVSFYRTNPGQFDNYIKYLRANFLPQQEEAKKQGLVVDYYILFNQPTDKDDWDVAVGYVYKNFGDALDYNQGDEDKMRKISENHFKTSDQEKVREMTAKRFEMRTYLGTKTFSEVKLKPLK